MGEEIVCERARKKLEKKDEKSKDYNEQMEYIYADICPKCGGENIKYVPGFWVRSPKFYICKDCGYEIKER